MSELADVLRRNLPQRQITIDGMLTSYRDALDTLDKGGMGTGDDGGGLWLNDVWKFGSYPLLEQLLKALRQEARAEPLVLGGITRSIYWHVAEWYLRSRLVRRPAFRVDRKGRRYQAMVAGVAQHELVTVRHEDVDPHRVLTGLQWLDSHWSLGARRQPETPGDTAIRLDQVRKLRVSAA